MYNMRYFASFNVRNCLMCLEVHTLTYILSNVHSSCIWLHSYYLLSTLYIGTITYSVMCMCNCITETITVTVPFQVKKWILVTFDSWLIVHKTFELDKNMRISTALGKFETSQKFYWKCVTTWIFLKERLAIFNWWTTFSFLRSTERCMTLIIE